MITLQNAIDRTDAKVRYALLTLEELVHHPELGGAGDFERAHLESFLFHLLGIKDAVLKELAVRFGVLLDEDKISASTLSKAGVAEAKVIVQLENDAASWLANASALRHYSTHQASVPRVLHVGGEHHMQVFLQNTRTGDVIARDQIEVSAEWLQQMMELVEELRLSLFADEGE